MRRIEDNQGGDESLAGPSISTHGPPREQTVIPFRRANPPPRCPADDDTPPVSSSPFESLGAVTQAVVMRLANKRIRVKVQVQTTEGTE
jgi:hypothetical protein